MLETYDRYKKLRELLEQGKWREADEETAALLLRIRGREKDGWLRRTKDINVFPCQDLCMIDELWVKYSNGRFGFSVQERIWRDAGCSKFAIEEFCSWPLESKYYYQTFGSRLGWWKKNRWQGKKNITFALSAPVGHLPIPFIHWHYSGQIMWGLPSKIVWMYGGWLATTFGIEGDGTMWSCCLWTPHFFSRLNECKIR